MELLAMRPRHYLALAGLIAVPAILSPTRYLVHLLLVEAAALGVLVVALLIYRLGRDVIDHAVAAHYDRRRLRRHQGPTIKAWMAAHSFPGDTLADIAELHGDVTYADVESDAYRAGREDEAWAAHERRSAAARRGARTRRRRYDT
jgi:hypothetical protein